MSIMELTYEFVSIALACTKFYSPHVYPYILILAYALTIAWVNILIALTVDRFAEIRLNIKYSQYVSRKVTNVVIVVSYASGKRNYLLIVLV